MKPSFTVAKENYLKEYAIDLEVDRSLFHYFKEVGHRSTQVTYLLETINKSKMIDSYRLNSYTYNQTYTETSGYIDEDITNTGVSNKIYTIEQKVNSQLFTNKEE